jgi:4-amino-4-deoxy-L-arabinose transferase-like glycosyltransferase
MHGSSSRALGGGVLLALIASAFLFHHLGRYPLLDPDEARHAEVAREMAAAHGLRRLLLPTLELEPYREKPAGYYWLVALAYAAAGVDEGATRSVSAAAALGGVLAVYAYAAGRVGVVGALGAGAVLLTTGGWLAFGRYANLDMTLTLFVTLGVLGGLAWLERPLPRRPPLLPYVAMGLGTLVKGPIAGLLVAGPLVLAGLVRRPRPGLRELGLLRGALVAGAIVAALYVPAALLDPSYLVGFAATNVRRLRPGSPHAEPPYFYLLWLPALFLPWTLFAAGPLGRAARHPVRQALVLWAAFVPAVLTLARGKLPSYALSALVPLALVVGPDLAAAALVAPADEDRPFLRAGGWIAAATLALVAPGAVVVALYYPVAAAAPVLLGAAGLVWAAGLVLLLRRGRLGLVPPAVLGATLTLVPLLVRLVVPAIGALHSDRDAARLVAGTEGTPAPVIAFAARTPSLVFYLRSPVIRTEDPQMVRELFAGDGPVFLVTGHRHFAEIEELLGPRAHVWHANRRRRLYANRPPPPEANGSR